MQDSQVLIAPRFIAPSEQDVLREWAERMQPYLRPNRRGPMRAFRQVQDLPHIPDAYTETRRRVQGALGVNDEDCDPEVGWILSRIGNGGFVHPHRDPVPDGFRHLRCNLFIQTPLGGGVPVIDSVPQPFEERMLLCFFASERRHWSTPVEGDRARIMCSFGYLVSQDFCLPAHLSVRAQPD